MQLNRQEKEKLAKSVKFIIDNVDYVELLALLAEEAAELSQAALKMRRVAMHDAKPDVNVYPTFKSFNTCLCNLFEEIDDVQTCELLLISYKTDTLEEIMKKIDLFHFDDDAIRKINEMPQRIKKYQAAAW
jgi:hypothetical protein